MADPTMEKDVDLSTDRDSRQGVDRASLMGADRSSVTGSDSKVSSQQNRVDVGADENTAAVLSQRYGADSTLSQLAGMQFMRHSEELHDRRMKREDELSVIRQRQLTQGSDYDQDSREMRINHGREMNEIKSSQTRDLHQIKATHFTDRHSQDVRHQDVAADRIWNVDEQGYQVQQVLSTLATNGVDNRVAYAAVLEAAAGLLRQKASEETT